MVTDLAISGYSDAQTAMTRRWKSNAYKKYKTKHNTLLMSLLGHYVLSPFWLKTLTIDG